MTDQDDPYNLRKKSNAELHHWISGHAPGSDEYTAGIFELMRRNDAPVRKREWIAIGLAVISITIAMIVIVVTYQ